MSNANLPPFVEHGGMQSYAPPVRFEEGRMYGFLFKGESENLQKLCDQLLNRPSGGAVEYVPLLPYILLTFVDLPVGRFLSVPDMGYGSEREVDLWVPLARIKREGDLKIVEQVVWFVPYLFVDNAVAMTTGREVWGWLKEYGWITMPSQESPQMPFSLETIGAKEFGQDTHIDRIRLLDLKPTGDAPGSIATEWHGVEDLVHGLLRAMGYPHELDLPGFELAKEVWDMFVHQEMPIVFLKQFRDVRQGDKACYQAITQAPARVLRLTGGELVSQHELLLQQLESHPIGRDLGLHNQASILSFEIDLDFELGAGEEVWRA